MATKDTPQGSNSTRSRSRNRQVVLALIQSHGQMGRAEIARTLGLSTQAVSNIIAELLEEELLREMGTRSTGRGLPAVLYGLNPPGAYALGIEIRPNAVFAALLDLSGEVVFERRAQVISATSDAICDILVDMRSAALAKVDAPLDRLLGAGVVMPGPFGNTGLSGQGTDLPGWQDVAAQPLFQNALGVPVEVSNDANAAAMAERIIGAAKDVRSYAYLYCGTGLGLGLVSQGHLIPGAFGNAGEIGHISVPVPGGVAPLETTLSRVSVSHHLRGEGKEIIGYDELATLAAGGDSGLDVWMDQAASALAYAIQIIENLFDPQTVILGGAMPPKILDQLISRTVLPKNSVSNRADSPLPRLQAGVCGPMTVTHGAAALILNKTLSP